MGKDVRRERGSYEDIGRRQSSVETPDRTKQSGALETS